MTNPAGRSRVHEFKWLVAIGVVLLLGVSSYLLLVDSRATLSSGPSVDETNVGAEDRGESGSKSMSRGDEDGTPTEPSESGTPDNPHSSKTGGLNGERGKTPSVKTVAGAEPGLATFRITAQPRTITRGEPAYVSCKLRSLVNPVPKARGLSLYVRSDDTSQWRELVIGGGNDERLSLPGRAWSNSLEGVEVRLPVHFSLVYERAGVSREYPLWERAGRYQIRGTLLLETWREGEAVKVLDVKSNIVEIAVQECPAQDRAALALIADSRWFARLHANDVRLSECDEYAAWLNQFLQAHPASIYAPHVMLSRATLDKAPKVTLPLRERRKMLQRILTEFPYFSRTAEVLFYLVRYTLDLAAQEPVAGEALKYFQRLESQHSESHWVEKANEELRRVGWGKKSK